MVSMHRGDLVAVFGADGVRLELRRELSNLREIEGYAVSWGGQARVTLAAQQWQIPSIALFAGRLVFWIGSRLCVAALDGSAEHHCETLQEIVNVLPTEGGRWVVGTELGVELRSSDLVDRMSRYEHGEIILSVELEGARVSVRDLEGRQVTLGLPELRAL